MQRRALEAEARFYQVVQGRLLAADMIDFSPVSICKIRAIWPGYRATFHNILH